MRGKRTKQVLRFCFVRLWDCVHICMGAHTPTNTHTHTHAHRHTHTQTHTHTHTHVCTDTHMHTHTHTQTHTYTNTHTNKHTHTHKHTDETHKSPGINRMYLHICFDVIELHRVKGGYSIISSTHQQFSSHSSCS